MAHLELGSMPREKGVYSRPHADKDLVIWKLAEGLIFRHPQHPMILYSRTRNPFTAGLSLGLPPSASKSMCLPMAPLREA